MVFPEKKFKAEFLQKHLYSPSIISLEAARWGYEQKTREVESSDGYKSLLKQAEDYAMLASKPLLAAEFKRGFEAGYLRAKRDCVVLECGLRERSRNKNRCGIRVKGTPFSK